MAVTMTGSWNSSAQSVRALLEVMTVLPFFVPGGNEVIKQIALVPGNGGISHFIHHHQSGFKVARSPASLTVCLILLHFPNQLTHGGNEVNALPCLTGFDR